MTRDRVDACVVTVAVGDRQLAFAVSREPSDPIAEALMEGRFPLDAIKDFWLHLIHENGATHKKVIDIGAHLGTYAVPAAAAGADVVAVEGSLANAALLTLTAESNKLGNLEIRRAVAAAETGTVAFVALGPYGHIATTAELASNAQPEMNVKAIAIDDVIGELGWNRVDLVKIDVEGSELTAMKGMRQLLGRPDAPTILVEANAHMLAYYGQEPADVLRELEKYEFSCYLIDSQSPGFLVPVESGDIQTECVADYVAVKTMPGLGDWQIRAPFSRSETVQRIIRTTETFDQARIHRSYGERLIRSAPEWLKDDCLIRPLKRTLEREDFSLGFRHADLGSTKVGVGQL